MTSFLRVLWRERFSIRRRLACEQLVASTHARLCSVARQCILQISVKFTRGQRIRQVTETQGSKAAANVCPGDVLMLQLWLQQGLSETARHGTFECHRNDRNPMVLTLPRKEHLSVLKGKKITHPFPGLCALINPMSGIIRKESQHCQQSVPVSTGWHHS